MQDAQPRRGDAQQRRRQHEPHADAREAPALAPREDVDHRPSRTRRRRPSRRRSSRATRSTSQPGAELDRSPQKCDAARRRHTATPAPRTAPNATISRLSHECRSPSTARNAYCGRPRWNMLAASASSPNTSAVDGVQRPQRRDAARPLTSRSQQQARRQTRRPTSCVSTSITTSGQCACCGLTRK